MLLTCGALVGMGGIAECSGMAIGEEKVGVVCQAGS
jgi:hypothetical protein